MRACLAVSAVSGAAGSRLALLAGCVGGVPVEGSRAGGVLLAAWEGAGCALPAGCGPAPPPPPPPPGGRRAGALGGQRLEGQR